MSIMFIVKDLRFHRYWRKNKGYDSEEKESNKCNKQAVTV